MWPLKAGKVARVIQPAIQVRTAHRIMRFFRLLSPACGGGRGLDLSAEASAKADSPRHLQTQHSTVTLRQYAPSVFARVMIRRKSSRLTVEGTE